jgi:uncharacterized DUF497 family protein
VEFEWDEAKRAANIAKHDIDFEAANSFIWADALIEESPQGGEMRYAATSYIGRRLHQLVFTMRGERVRIISLRKAHWKEVAQYERDQA